MNVIQNFGLVNYSHDQNHPALLPITAHTSKISPPLENQPSMNALDTAPSSKKKPLVAQVLKRGDRPKRKLTHYHFSKQNKSQSLRNIYNKAMELLEDKPGEAYVLLNDFVEHEVENQEKRGIAFNILGDMYRQGIGTERNLREAKRAYFKAYNLGLSVGQYNLGLLYETPNFFEFDLENAQNCFKKYTQEGGWAGYYKLGMLLKNAGKDFEAIEQFKKCINESKKESNLQELEDFKFNIDDSYRQLKKLPSSPFKNSLLQVQAKFPKQEILLDRVNKISLGRIKGSVKFSSGRYYEGEMRNGKPDGYGKFFDKKGKLLYMGQCAAGRFLKINRLIK